MKELFQANGYSEVFEDDHAKAILEMSNSGWFEKNPANNGTKPSSSNDKGTKEQIQDSQDKEA